MQKLNLSGSRDLCEPCLWMFLKMLWGLAQKLQLHVAAQCLRQAGFFIPCLKLANYKADEFVNVGFTMSQIKQQGYTAREFNGTKKRLGPKGDPSI